MDVLALIENVGFPIFMCLILLYYVNKQSERHKEEMDAINSALRENTMVISQLADAIRSINYEKGSNTDNG